MSENRGWTGAIGIGGRTGAAGRSVGGAGPSGGGASPSAAWNSSVALAGLRSTSHSANRPSCSDCMMRRASNVRRSSRLSASVRPPLAWNSLTVSVVFGPDGQRSLRRRNSRRFGTPGSRPAIVDADRMRLIPAPG
jgi:hypothetical protein